MKEAKKLRWLLYGAVIAALYVVLTELENLLLPTLANGVIQVRFSEALNVFACFTSAAVPGVFIGCIIANILGGCIIWDVIFGSLASLIGAIGTYFLRKNRILALLCPIISNTVIVPLVLKFAYQAEGTVPFFMLTVAIGEIISCGLLGYLLGLLTNKYQKYIFR